MIEQFLPRASLPKTVRVLCAWMRARQSSGTLVYRV
jgi:hypothetical protein